MTTPKIGAHFIAESGNNASQFRFRNCDFPFARSWIGSRIVLDSKGSSLPRRVFLVDFSNRRQSPALTPSFPSFGRSMAPALDGMEPGHSTLYKPSVVEAAKITPRSLDGATAAKKPSPSA